MYTCAAILVALVGSSSVLASSRPTHPPEATHGAERYERNLAEGWTPRPTDGPKAVFGRMDLQPRLDGYTMGLATCGFIPTNNSTIRYLQLFKCRRCTLTNYPQDVIACQSAGDVCKYESRFAGCCDPNQSCSAIKKKCYDYSESLAGSCSDLQDFHTICCRTRASGQCFTWRISMTGGNGQPSGRFTLYDCSSTSGIGTLLNYDPVWALTHNSESTPTATPTTPTPISDPTAPPTPTATETEGSKTNVGAIAGGTVGGVAAIALVGTAVFLLLRRKKDDGKDSTTNTSPPAPMSQQPYSPVPQNQHPGSPGNQPSYSQQQPYDPHMSTYSQQPYPSQEGYQQPYNTQYPQQQWSAYGHNPSFSATDPSPGPYTTPSPGPPPPGVPGGEQRHVSELHAVNPVGMESNRAELH